jgi:polar amino acid transport system substrate-binding protein
MININAPTALIASGTLRATINLGNPILARQSGPHVTGVSVDLARELAHRLGVDVEHLVVPSAREAVEAISSGKADVGFFAVDPERGREIAFTDPYVLIEGCYVVRAESTLWHSDEVDDEKNWVAVGQGSAYDLYLTRHLKRSPLVRVPTSPAVVEAMLQQRIEVAARVRQQLEADMARFPGLRMLDGSFMSIRQALGLPRSKGDEALRFLHAFVADVKASGFVAECLARHGVQGVSIAP